MQRQTMWYIKEYATTCMSLQELRKKTPRIYFFHLILTD